MFDRLVGILCWLMCMFCDCCDGHKDCPDGVCDPLRTAIADLDAESSKPSEVKARSISLDWTRIQFVIEKAVALIEEIKLFVFAK